MDHASTALLHPSQGEPSLGSRRTSQKWYVASWNVRTLLNVQGLFEAARRFRGGSVVDERKVDQVLSELDRYGVVVAGLQETKWFGSKIYKVRKSVKLSYGSKIILYPFVPRPVSEKLADHEGKLRFPHSHP